MSSCQAKLLLKLNRIYCGRVYGVDAPVSQAGVMFGKFLQLNCVFLGSCCQATCRGDLYFTKKNSYVFSQKGI